MANSATQKSLYKNTLSFDERVMNLSNRTTSELMEEIVSSYKKSLKRGQNYLFISYLSLADRIKKSSPTVRRSIKTLESLGFIAVSPYDDGIRPRRLKISMTQKWHDFDRVEAR